MKLFCLIIFSIMIFSSGSFAAIQYLPFTCTGTHAKGKPFPIPDAPSFSIACDIREGGVSGSGKSCDLTIHRVFPLGRETTSPMQTVSESRGVTVFRVGDTTAHVNWKKQTAEINTGFGGEADCTAKAIQTSPNEEQKDN